MIRYKMLNHIVLEWRASCTVLCITYWAAMSEIINLVVNGQFHA